MNYGLTIYGPLVDNVAAREGAKARLYDVFKTTSHQANAVWETLRDFPHFNSAHVYRRSSAGIAIEIYYEPLHARDHPDCVFHAKISEQGRYE